MAGWNVGHTPSNPATNTSPLFIPPPIGAVQGGEPLGFGDPRIRNNRPPATPYSSASHSYQLPGATSYGGWPTPGFPGQAETPSMHRAPSAAPSDQGFVSTAWHRPPQNTPAPTDLYQTPSQYGRGQNMSNDSDQSGHSPWRGSGGTPRGAATPDPYGVDHSQWQQQQQPPPNDSNVWAAGERTADAWGATHQAGQPGWGTPGNQPGNDHSGWGTGNWADPGGPDEGGAGGWGPQAANMSPQADNKYLSATAFGALNRSVSHEKPKAKKRKHRTRSRASSDPAWALDDAASPLPPTAELPHNNFGTFQPSPYGAPGFSSSSLAPGPLWPGYPPESDYNELNVAKRPRDWREEYSVRGGINFRVPLSPSRSDIREISDPVKRLINPMLAYHHNPSVTWDIEGDPFIVGPISFPYLRRQHNDLDYAQLASTPGAPVLRLFHPRYPWYIDVRSSHENGVTVGDVLMQVFLHFMTPITPRHFYNEDVGQRERDLMSYAWSKRTKGDPRAHSQGILKVDFLGMEGLLRFVGLSRTRSGMWEMKLKKVDSAVT